MSALTWHNTTVTLGNLKPWAHNPRYSTKAQAKRLLQSWKDLGQFQTIAIGPDGEVYDGHQRLSALLTVYGPEYTIDARQCDRALSDEERQKLVITAHVGAVGSWDWDKLAGWDAPQLGEWGMDAETLRAWNSDAGNLRTMLGIDDPNAEWEGMPEFDNSPLAHRSLHVHFAGPDDVAKFAELIGQRITDKTRSIWFPPQDIDHHARGYEYGQS